MTHIQVGQEVAKMMQPVESTAREAEKNIQALWNRQKGEKFYVHAGELKIMGWGRRLIYWIFDGYRDAVIREVKETIDKTVSSLQIATGNEEKIKTLFFEKLCLLDRRIYSGSLSKSVFEHLLKTISGNPEYQTACLWAKLGNFKSGQTRIEIFTGNVDGTGEGKFVGTFKTLDVAKHSFPLRGAQVPGRIHLPIDFSAFNDGLLLNIFAHLQVPTLMKFSRVSKRWGLLVAGILPAVLRGQIEGNYQSKMYKEALEDLNLFLRCIEPEEPNYFWALRLRAEVKNYLVDHAGALADCEAALQLQPKNALVLRDRGNAKYCLGKFKEAVEDLKESLRLEPKNAQTLRLLGQAKLKDRNYEGALRDLTQALLLEPNDAWTVGRQGLAKYYLKRYEEALVDLNTSLAVQPRDPACLRVRGYIHCIRKEFQAALEDLNLALEIEPDHALALQRRGAVWVELNRLGEAVIDYERFNKLSPQVGMGGKKRELKEVVKRYGKALSFR